MLVFHLVAGVIQRLKLGCQSYKRRVTEVVTVANTALGSASPAPQHLWNGWISSWFGEALGREKLSFATEIAGFGGGFDSKAFCVSPVSTVLQKFPGSIRKGCLLSQPLKLHVHSKNMYLQALLVVALLTGNVPLYAFILGFVLFLSCVRFSPCNLDSWISAYGLSDLFMLLMVVCDCLTSSSYFFYSFTSCLEFWQNFK